MANYNKVLIQPGWQLITIPVRYGYWDINTSELIYDTNVEATIKNYVCDQIESITGQFCFNSISACITYYGDEERFLTYLPDRTDEDSDHNFKLAHLDVVPDNIEYTSFWIHNKTLSSIEITHLEAEITWIDGGTF